MEEQSAYFIPLAQDMSESLRREYCLKDDFFGSLEGSVIDSGNLKAEVTAWKTAGGYHIDYAIAGEVTVQCDRCLGDMQVQVETGGEFKVRVCIGADEADEDTIVMESEAGGVDMAWYLYEAIALNVPLRHVHPDGECDSEMEAKLAACSPNAGTEEDKPADPRWDALKNIKIE